MDEQKDYMITTIDNNYNPFTDYDAWSSEDSRLGYETPGLIARLGGFSSELSEKDYLLEYYDVCERILTMFPSLYRKVYKNEKV